MVVDISQWGYKPQYLMATPPTCQVTEGATGLPRFAWKMAIKTVCVHIHAFVSVCYNRLTDIVPVACVSELDFTVKKSRRTFLLVVVLLTLDAYVCFCICHLSIFGENLVRLIREAGNRSFAAMIVLWLRVIGKVPFYMELAKSLHP